MLAALALIVSLAAERWRSTSTGRVFMYMFPPVALPLAGFALAHAAWSISDSVDDELLCPLAIVERSDSGRELLRFEADTQEEAIALGKNTLADRDADIIAWAFAREGTWRPTRDRSVQDVFTVEFWAKGMATPAIILQPFERRAKRDAFRVMGSPILVVDGRIVPSPSADLALGVDAGVRSHPKVAELWSAWQA